MVLITGEASVETAVEALRRGVADYLTKPVDFARLKAMLGNLARALEMKSEIGTLRTELRKMGRFGRLVGASPPMQKVYDLIGRVARTDAGILITGETGTGKEVVAQTIHALSRRRKHPFVPVDCGAISPTLIESELFGHERGSFTGAERMHKGYFERAHLGTLFLDEVTEMPPALQVKLLRVLETSSVLRVGADKPIKVDVRIVAATNRRPDEAVATGKLREDLLYRILRLSGWPDDLRDRLSAARSERRLRREPGRREGRARRGQGLDDRWRIGARERLRRHAWPGNLRELKNVVHHAFILADQELDLEALADAGTGTPASPSLTMPVGAPLADAERRLILAAVEQFAGDKQKAAAALRISLTTLYNRLNEYKAS